MVAIALKFQGYSIAMWIKVAKMHSVRVLLFCYSSACTPWNL